MSDILFVCVHNAGRNQMARSFFNKLAREFCIPMRAEAAGTEPAKRVHPAVAEAMREVGIDMSGDKPRIMANEDAGAAGHCDGVRCGCGCLSCAAAARCGGLGTVDTAGKSLPEVRAIRDEVERRVTSLVTGLHSAHLHTHPNLTFPRQRGRDI